MLIVKICKRGWRYSIRTDKWKIIGNRQNENHRTMTPYKIQTSNRQDENHIGNLKNIQGNHTLQMYFTLINLINSVLINNIVKTFRTLIPRWLLKCLTNSIPSSSFFFQNLTCPSQLAVTMKSNLARHTH